MTLGSAGYDLHSSEETVIASHSRQLVATGIAITVPAGTYARIAPCSRMSAKHSIDVGAGVMDGDYTGEVKVLLINHSDKEYQVRTGDRIAQLILEKIKTPETKMTTELKPTSRGNKGFGSTGISTCLVTINSNDMTDDVSNQSEAKTYSYDDAVKRLGYDPIKEYPDVFPEKKPTELPPLRKINHTIDLIDKDKYRHRRPRRIRPSEAFLPQLRDKINAELETGRIYPAQDSAACSMFMIKKHNKQNEARFLHNLVDRNANTRKDNTPIPDIPSIINTVARHPCRSMIDLTDGYHNVRIELESETFMSFYTPFGTFRTKVMQQGDCNAPATFLKLMNWIFAEQIGRDVYVYLDDILIFSKTKEEHIASLKELCDKLRQHKLFGNRSKTMILPDTLSILGHTITSKGLSAEPQKILKVGNWSTPTKRKELQGFMGIVNYLSTYVPHLATVPAPLTRLCRDTVKFKWEPIHDASLQQVKDIISTKAILKPINYESTNPIFLITDASVKGIGA